jgi:hypothetical protein
VHDQLTKLKIQIEFLNQGIVPVGEEGAPAWYDINRILADLPSEEARRMKRKFRKLWRRVVIPKLRHGGREGRQTARAFGVGGPVRGNKNNRKYKVYTEIRNKVTKQ